MKANVIARRYASALFLEAKEQGNTESVLEDLSGIVSIKKTSSDFEAFLKNPLISKTEKMAVVDSIKDKGGLSEFAHTFLKLLAEKNRLEFIEEIRDHLKYIIMDEKGEAAAYIRTAAELDEDSRNGLKEALGKAAGKKISLEETVDAEIIGGVIAKIGSTQYDASIKGQMDKLRDQLIS
ncbi:ATP synthase F1 subunit delta [Limisalsivibrio acetivorans]|uniref:ATP synthase F1 subunit delta n=1 Tax=Limisalsivibrio acetivorans TaxID=1304888 RepID=UPI0003B53CC1|nr:ATP synthase F1 subunit delta [Limisalsivibrio acetivorans]